MFALHASFMKSDRYYTISEETNFEKLAACLVFALRICMNDSSIEFSFLIHSFNAVYLTHLTGNTIPGKPRGAHNLYYIDTAIFECCLCSFVREDSLM